MTLGNQDTTPAVSRHRQYRGAMAKVITGFSAIVILYALLYVSGALAHVGVHIYGGIHRALILTFIMVMVFLLFPATKGAARDRLPWYDAILALLSLVAGSYLALNIIQIDEAALPANTLQQVLAVIMVVLVLECGRRAVSWIYTVLGILFLTYPFYAQFLPGAIHSLSYSLQRVLTTVYLNSEVGVNGNLMHIMATIIFVFITFGALLQATGAGQFFIDLASGLLGRYRGGPAKVAVVASGFFACMSGSGTANVATTGVITIPLMKATGYKPHFAGAVEAAASAGGMFTPPVMASLAFIMADFLGRTYLEVCIAAFIPALLYYLALLIMVDLEAAKTGLRGLPPQEIPSGRRTLAGGWFYLVPVAVLVFLLVVLHYRAPTAGICALVSVVLVSFLGKKENRMGLRKLWETLSRAGRMTLEVGAAIAIASMLISSLALTGVGIKVTAALVELAGGSQLILVLLAAAIALIMGMGVGPVSVYITLALLVAPALIQAGIVPMAAHLFLVFLAVASVITPPICIASFVAATIAGSNFMRTGFTAVRLGIVAFLVPFVFVYSPELLLIGSAGQVALAVLTALVGIVLLSAGMQGYFLTGFGLWARLLLVAAGVVMIVPGWITDAAGVAVGAAILLWQMRTSWPFRLGASKGEGY